MTERICEVCHRDVRESDEPHWIIPVYYSTYVKGKFYNGTYDTVCCDDCLREHLTRLGWKRSWDDEY